MLLSLCNCVTYLLTDDGIWEDWTEWFSCNVTCGGGTQTRTRACHPPKYGGKYCQGVDAQWQNCSDNPCPSKALFLLGSTFNPCPRRALSLWE